MAFSWLSIGVLAASILVKLWLSGFNRAVGKKINSETLMATAADSRNDVLTTGAVLLSTILCSLTGYGIMDGIMGVGVAAFILWSGWGLVMDTLSPLLGMTSWSTITAPGTSSPPCMWSSRPRPTR